MPSVRLVERGLLNENYAVAVVGRSYMTDYKEVRCKVSKLLYSRLKRCARKRGCSMSEIVRKGTIKFINEYEDAEKKNELY